ncbi:FGGY-family carbohydrate kinase [Rubrobacter indicoceani]|uniref:FGGY-family carbohydrate kinase n=1 Tax=Rubrobacter indicoceani TaxID=2051957 RepID=UPI0013C4A01B|nr:FGGY-family carbohydrate kinase [Rubrobacter indicoceani]
MGGLVLGLDCGLTVTKAVIFDERGRAVSSAGTRVPQETPRSRWVERDVEALWQASAEAIRLAIEKGNLDPRDIVGVGVTAHGDGLYLLDAAGNPTRRGILSLDSRAHLITERWESEGRFERMLEITGQVPGPLSPAALLAWVIENEPEVMENSRWALSCKDVMKMRLTGEVSADPTEASTAFCDVNTQSYSSEALAVYGLEGYESLLAPVIGCEEIAGVIGPEVAELTGLATGTPVVSGLHDVDASAIGIGSLQPGQLAMVAGTASINEVISDHPVSDPRWFARNFVRPGQWMHMSLSLASAGNLEWFVQRLCRADYEGAADRGEDSFAFIEREISAIADASDEILFLPFLYGSPHGAAASGTFLGMRGWHTRGHMLEAILEGVVFNHRTHVDALREAFSISEGRLTGGAVRSRRWAQMFADVIGLDVLLTDAEESGALGAAMCAAVGTGLHNSLEEASSASVRVVERLEPDPGTRERVEAKYSRYHKAVKALAEVWEAQSVVL